MDNHLKKDLGLLCVYVLTCIKMHAFKKSNGDKIKVVESNSP